MDSLPEDDIEAIWGRIKYRLSLNEVKGKNKSEVQREVKQLMMSPFFPMPKNSRPQQSPKFLVEKGIVERFIGNEKILKEIYSHQISKIKVRGKERFIIKKGSSSFESKSGKNDFLLHNKV